MERIAVRICGHQLVPDVDGCCRERCLVDFQHWQPFQQRKSPQRVLAASVHEFLQYGLASEKLAGCCGDFPPFARGVAPPGSSGVTAAA
jgi:hypothetical protein